MKQDTDPPLPPTLTRVLDAFLQAMKADKDIDDATADRLDALLRKNQTPKPDEIEEALFPPPPEYEDEGAEGDGV